MLDKVEHESELKKIEIKLSVLDKLERELDLYMTLVYMVLGFDLLVVYLVYRVIMYYRGEQKNVRKRRVSRSK